jgi:hypothetical protein
LAQVERLPLEEQHLEVPVEIVLLFRQQLLLVAVAVHREETLILTETQAHLVVAVAAVALEQELLVVLVHLDKEMQVELVHQTLVHMAAEAEAEQVQLALMEVPVLAAMAVAELHHQSLAPQ